MKNLMQYEWVWKDMKKILTDEFYKQLEKDHRESGFRESEIIKMIEDGRKERLKKK